LELIDLANGQPSPSLLGNFFPPDLTADLGDRGRWFPYTERQGLPELRQALSLLQGAGVPQAGTIAVHGVLGGIDLVVRSLAGDRARIVTPLPGYKEALAIFRAAGLPIEALPLRDGKLDPEALDSALDRRTLVYVVPTLNNPDGRSLDAAERALLARACVHRGAALIEDDSYLGLAPGLEAPPILSLVLGESPTHDAYRLTGLSKTLAPGARVGLLEAPPERIAEMAAAKADFGLSPLLSEVVRQLLVDPDRIRSARGNLAGELARRSARLLAALRQSCSEARWTEPRGGYFLWGTLPGEADCERLLGAARESGVLFEPGTSFFPSGGKRHLRVACGAVTEAQLDEGAERIGVAVADHLGECR
jgi:2-aminoadipate transaminase